MDVVELHPLSVETAERVLHDELEVEPDPAFAAACHRATGGVPLLAGQLVPAAREDGLCPAAEAVGRIEGLGAGRAARWILVGLGRLAPEATRLARALAVLEQAELARRPPSADFTRNPSQRPPTSWCRRASSARSAR